MYLLLDEGQSLDSVRFQVNKIIEIIRSILLLTSSPTTSFLYSVMVVIATFQFNMIGKTDNIILFILISIRHSCRSGPECFRLLHVKQNIFLCGNLSRRVIVSIIMPSESSLADLFL